MKLICAVLGLVALSAASRAQIEYSLAPDPAAGSIRVSASAAATSEITDFRIPAWCPGFYFLLDYPAKVFDAKATSGDGATLPIERPNRHTWRVRSRPGSKVTFSYRVLGDDAGLGFFGVSVKSHTAFVNGPAAFVYIEGRKEEFALLRVQLPDEWDVATGMDEAGVDKFAAASYDEFIDHPMQLGRFEKRKFVVGKYRFEVAIASEDQTYRTSPDAIADELMQLSRPAIAMFGEAPFKRYVYLIHLARGGFQGGLEHRASTLMALPNVPNLKFETLAAHEFFHTWNVKHIRPKVLGPFDYTQAVRTNNLWFAEGVTDYYAQLHVYQAGAQGPTWLLSQLSNEIQTLQRSKTRLTKTLEQAGWETWENGGFGVGDLSYYNKGLVVGLVLDAALRGATEGKQSLDDVLRTLMKRHALPQPGYGEDDLRTTINEIAGRDLSALYDRCVRSTQELPYEELRKIGLRLAIPGRIQAHLPFELLGDVVRSADAGSGFQPGDKVLAVNQRPFAPGAFSGLTMGDKVQVDVQRSSENLRVEVAVGSSTPSAYRLANDPFASAEQVRRRDGWLRIPSDLPAASRPSGGDRSAPGESLLRRLNNGVGFGVR